MTVHTTRVCKSCKSNCFKDHSTDSNSVCLSFFKVMERDSDFSFIEIASQCLEQIKSKGCRHIILEDPSGCLYPTLLCCSDSVVLKDGWQDFAASQSLELGDIIVFTVVGDTHFLVQIFESSGNEKQANEVSDYIEEEKRAMLCHGYQRKRGRRKMKFMSTKEIFRSSKSIEKDELKFSKVLTKCAVSGKAFCMTIPASFARRWLPQARTKFLLSCGWRKWWVDFDGRLNSPRFNLSWKYFALDNQLKVGDTCLFELKDIVNHIFTVEISRASCKAERKFRPR